MKNTDYNKPSEIWFSQLASPQQLIQSVGTNFIIRLTEEAVKEMDSIHDIHEILGKEYVVIRGLGLPGMFLVSQTTFDTVNTLNYNKKIEFFEPDEFTELDDPIPSDNDVSVQNANDNKWSSMWHLNPSVNSAFNAKVVPLWNQGFTGSRDVVVGVVDTGTQIDHPDLVNNLWTNPNPTETSTNDSYTDDIHGIGISADRRQTGGAYVGNYTAGGRGISDLAHGTHCAGIIGAEGDNNIGTVGVCKQVSIMSLRGFYNSNSFIRIYNSDAIKMINYAIAQKLKGINVVALNHSYGGTRAAGTVPLSVRMTHQAASNAGIIMVIAAGNDTKDIDTNTFGPADLGNIEKYGIPNIITVGAMSKSGGKAYFSNWGQNTVTIAAPGVDIWSTIINGQYQAFQGTSMAAPVVAGAVALLASMFPQASASQIKNAIVNGAAATGSWTDDCRSGGRLDVERAAELLGSPSSPPPPGPPPPAGPPPPPPVTGPNQVTVLNLRVNDARPLLVTNNHPVYGCGSNITPTISWTVGYQGLCNDSNTVFDIRMVDTNTNLAHWFITDVRGTARNVSNGNLQGATIRSSQWPSLQNNDGYVGPFPPNNTQHFYEITVTPRSSVVGAKTLIPDDTTKPNANCDNAPTPTPSPTQGLITATPTPTPTKTPLVPSPPPPVVGTNGTVEHIDTIQVGTIVRNNSKTFARTITTEGADRRLIIYGMVDYSEYGSADTVRTKVSVNVNGTNYACTRHGDLPYGRDLGSDIYSTYYGRYEVYVSDKIPNGTIADIKFECVGNDALTTNFGKMSVLSAFGFSALSNILPTTSTSLGFSVTDKQLTLLISRTEDAVNQAFTLGPSASINNTTIYKSFTWYGHAWSQHSGGPATKTFTTTAAANQNGAPRFYAFNFPLAIAPSPTPTPTVTATPPGPPPPPPPPSLVYPNSSNELYVSDFRGNIFTVDVSDKRSPKVVKDSTDKVISSRSSNPHYKLAIHRANDSHFYDQFYTSNFTDGGYRSGAIYSNKTTDQVNRIITTNSSSLSYLKIIWNQKVINFTHSFRDRSNITLSFDDSSLIRPGQEKDLELHNVSLSELKTDLTDSYTKEFLLSTTTSLPDWVYPLAFYVNCPTDRSLSRYFANRDDAVIYQNILINGGCSATLSGALDPTDPRYVALPTAFVMKDRQEIKLGIKPQAYSGGPKIANAYRQVYKMSNGITYSAQNRFNYILNSAGYGIPRDIPSISSSSAGGIGRPFSAAVAPCSDKNNIALLGRVQQVQPNGSSADYNGAIKCISGKYQTVAIDSNGNAYYTGNSNHGPFEAGTVIPLSAIGGEKTVVGEYTVHTFKQNGTFNISSLPAGTKFDVLVVGGGGGGGSDSKAGGGGGAGGVEHQTDIEFPSTGSYNITVGNGGGSQQNGQNSSIKSSSGFDITANGGRGAIARDGGASGSGYGGGRHKGGGSYIAGGGGGGANGIGIGGDGNLAWDPTQRSGPAYHLKGGDGGLPYETDISGTTQWYGGGGGGTTEPLGNQVYYVRGVGGGGRANDKSGRLTGIIYNPGREVSNPNWSTAFYTGAANNTPAVGNGGGGGQGYKQGRSSYPATAQTAGTPNTGGGGGAPSAAGGSGIVIIRYKTNQAGGGAENLDSMRKINAYIKSGENYSPTYVNFVDAAIMTYNHHGLDLADKSTYRVFLLDDRGELYSFGYDGSTNTTEYFCVKYNAPLIRIRPDTNDTFPPNNIASISAGADHAILIRHGQMYGLGSNTRGQLGSSDPSSKLTSFTSIPGSFNGRITKVACGPYHTMAMNTEGQLFVSGDNTCGQLGLGLNPNTSVNNHAKYGFTLLETPAPVKDIFASNVADHYIYQAPCTTNGRTRACQPGEDPNKPPIRSRSNCGYVSVNNTLYLWGDRTYGQSGNLLSTSYTGGAYVADGTMMISPVYVPFFYTAFRGTIAKNQSYIDNIPASWTPYVNRLHYINFNFLATRTTAAGSYNATSNRTTVTVANASGVTSGMWIQVGDLSGWGTGAQRGQVLSVSGNTITIIGNQVISNGSLLYFKAFKQNTRITSIETNTDGTLKANLSNPSTFTVTNSSSTQGVAYVYYNIRPEVAAAGKDGIAVVDNAGRFIHWGLDKGYRGVCSIVDKATRIPWLANTSISNTDHIDVSYGLDHLMVLRKDKPAQ